MQRNCSKRRKIRGRERTKALAQCAKALILLAVVLAPRPGLEPGTYGLTGLTFTFPGCPKKSHISIHINDLALYFVRRRARRFA